MAVGDERQFLPACWNDDSKMNVYFLPLRATTANPVGSASKITFWKTCIDSYCKTTKRCSFTAEELRQAFSRNGRTPECLQAVIKEMENSREILTLSNYMQSKPICETDKTWSEWAWELSKVPIYWTWNSLKNVVLPPSSSPTPDLKYVHKKTVQDEAENLFRLASDLRGKVVQLDELLEKCNLPKSRIEDILLAIYWLYCQNMVSVKYFDFNSPFNTLVKLATSDQTKVSISEPDICKYNLLKLQEKTEAKIAEYDEKIHQATALARQLISKKNKVLAMGQLKKKKMFEEAVKKEVEILLNVQSILETLNRAETNQEVIEAFKIANAAIKHVHREANLTEDTVLSVMDELRDTIETQESINSEISQSVVPEDNEELEKELNLLLSEDDLHKWVENMKLDDLPEPPKSVSPGPASRAPAKIMESDHL